MKTKKNWLARLIMPDDMVTGGEITATAYQPPSPEVMEKVLLTGDLAALQPHQRLSYYESVCRALKLNPLTKPFEYITLNGKLTLYARKDCTDQLRRTYSISLEIISREVIDGAFTVVARASMPIFSKGFAISRKDEAIGAVFLPASGPERANAIMKAETKAKRRVTLSICGLGMFDESEMESIPDNGNDAERRVKEATANRLADQGSAEWKKVSVTLDSEPLSIVTEENFNDVICHIGKPEGNMLEKKVSEIHPKLLQWLQRRYGPGDDQPRWGDPPTQKDERLKKAVDFALAKL